MENTGHQNEPQPIGDIVPEVVDADSQVVHVDEAAEAERAADVAARDAQDETMQLAERMRALLARRNRDDSPELAQEIEATRRELHAAIYDKVNLTQQDSSGNP